MTSPIAEAIESCTDLAKELLGKWRTYSSEIATSLDSGYDADTAAADLGKWASLTMETGALLGIGALNLAGILAGDYVDEVKYVKLSTQHKGAKLEWKKDLENVFEEVIPRDHTKITPSQLSSEQQTFVVRADTTGCRAGLYDGSVRASTPGGDEEVMAFEIEVP